MAVSCLCAPDAVRVLHRSSAKVAGDAAVAGTATDG
jgi:hypothetical protein